MCVCVFIWLVMWKEWIYCGINVTYKTFGSVVHEAELETLLVFKGLGQRVTQRVWGQHSLSTLLELTEDTLQGPEGNQEQLNIILIKKKATRSSSNKPNYNTWTESNPNTRPDVFTRWPLKRRRCRRPRGRNELRDVSDSSWRCPTAREPTGTNWPSWRTIAFYTNVVGC